MSNNKKSMFLDAASDNLTWKDVSDIGRLKAIIRYTIVIILLITILISSLFNSIHLPVQKLSGIILIIFVYQTIFYIFLKKFKDKNEKHVRTFYRLSFILIFFDLTAAAFGAYITNGIFSPFIIVMIFDIVSCCVLYPTAISIWIFLYSIAVIAFETLILFSSRYIPSKLIDIPVYYQLFNNQELILIISLFYFTFFGLLYFSINFLLRSPVQNLFISRKLQEFESANKELNQTHSELETVFELSEVINSALSLEQILSLVVEGIRNSLGFNIVLLSLLDKSKKTLLRQAKAGISDEDFESLKKKNIEFSVIEKCFIDKYKIGNCYYISHNAKLDGNINDYTWTAPDLQANKDDSINKWHPEDMLLIPLKSNKNNEIIGMISVDDPIDGKVPSRRKMKMLELFSNSASTAIENSLLFADKNKQIKQLNSIHDVSSMLTTVGLDKQELMNKVVSIIKSTFKYLNTAILLIDKERNVLKVAAKEGYANQQIEKLEIKIGEEGITGWVAESGTPLIINDVMSDSRYLEGFPGAASELAVPIKYKDDIIGVLDVESEEVNAFDQQDVELLRTLANYIATAIRNAELHQKTESLAKTDGLTELNNRRVFKDVLRNELQRAKRYNHPFSLIMIDIDNFKKYNDKWGHPEGDNVLKSLAQVFKASTRDVDTIARYGGEEFIIILPETAKKDALNIAERIRRNFNRINFYPKNASKPENMTISLGVATFPEDGTIAELMINNVDNALYKAKRSGKNKICILEE
ncbi:MAG: sensor domain-containing diguanylate cyclase [bacterium]|nr:sensor domain-containing diguanylate cyclase [bacterium]